jgi:hypothetical protein
VTQTCDKLWGMDVDVLFAGNAITDFEQAQAWYERFFGRVPDIEEVTSALEARGVTTGPIDQEGEAGGRAVVRDPDGNSIAIIEVAGSDS